VSQQAPLPQRAAAGYLARASDVAIAKERAWTERSGRDKDPQSYEKRSEFILGSICPLKISLRGYPETHSLHGYCRRIPCCCVISASVLRPCFEEQIR